MRIKVEFEIEIEDGIASDEQIEEWLRFELHDNGQCSLKNPLCYKTVEPIFGTFYWDVR